jgi:hypothetical protein
MTQNNFFLHLFRISDGDSHCGAKYETYSTTQPETLGLTKLKSIICTIKED